MRTKEIELYQFAELSDEAKERAREWYKQGAFDCDWWESIYEDAADAADMLGINLRTKRTKLINGQTRLDPAIYFSGFWSQGDGARFEGSYSYAKGAVKAIVEGFPQDKDLQAIARDLRDAQRPCFYRLEATIGSLGRYEHSGCMDIDVFDREDNYRNIGESEEAIKQALRDFADWIYQRLEQEYDWLNSDGQVDDAITANEYEFDGEGNRA